MAKIQFSIICMGKNQVFKYFCPVGIYIYTKGTKLFENFIIFHTNCTKIGLFMKRVTSKWYGIQLIGFQIRIIRIQISHI